MKPKIKTFRFIGLDTPTNDIDKRINEFIVNNFVSEVLDLKVTAVTTTANASGTRDVDLIYTLIYR